MASVKMIANSNKLPAVLTFSGSDSSGLAGMQTDIKTQAALGVHCATVITAVTAQNSHKVISVNPVSAQVFDDQLAANSGIEYAAIKSGLIANQSQLVSIAEVVSRLLVPFVCDPVLAATSGGDFTIENFAKVFSATLLPHCDLLTPNILEAQTLSNIKITSVDDIERAAIILCDLGAKSVYIKGGHLQTHGEFTQDYFYSKERCFWLSSPTIDTRNTRGTGCGFASAAASAMALGYAVSDAVIIAKMAVNQGLRQSYCLPVSTSSKITHEKGPLLISTFPSQQRDLPYLTASADFDFSADRFPVCDETPLGLYPVVDSVAWLTRLLAEGVSTAQLRVKDLHGDDLEQEIIHAISIGEKYNCRLFINDYWRLAIKHGAYGVHLGQEDLDDADILAIHAAGLKLGTSTHCHYEVARAHSFKPSYIACGPVYETTSKDMPWVPHGLAGLQYWQNVLSYPLVGIGGINAERITNVAATGVSGVAMITGITLSDEPEQTTRDFIKILAEQL